MKECVGLCVGCLGYGCCLAMIPWDIPSFDCLLRKRPEALKEFDAKAVRVYGRGRIHIVPRKTYPFGFIHGCMPEDVIREFIDRKLAPYEARMRKEIECVFHEPGGSCAIYDYRPWHCQTMNEHRCRSGMNEIGRELAKASS